MSRIIDVFEQFLDDNGNPLSNGFLQFFQNGTAIPEPTYDDPGETIVNPANVPLDGEGRLTLNVYGSVLFTVKKFNSVAAQKGSNDNVRPRGAPDAVFGQFNLWDAAVSYGLNDLVKGSNGRFYVSLADTNLNNDPTSDAANWKEWPVNAIWNTNITYVVGYVSQTTDGNLWKAQTATAGNDPETDDGTNWLPAIDSANVLIDTNTVIPQITSGTLTVLRVNELKDGGSFTIPLANTVNDNQVIIITQPDEFVSFEPVITRSGGDTITDSSGTDTSITFDNAQSVEITLTSDGVSDWRL